MKTVTTITIKNLSYIYIVIIDSDVLY